MNILLTNDDGYNSEGILTLKKVLARYGRVVLCAPKDHMSAKSVSITLGKPIKVEKSDDDIFIVDGTPADCVSFALSSLSIDFDIVFSGCNNGPNISYDTMYSGTIGACLEALKFHKKAVAVSCFSNFEIVEQYFDKVYSFILQNNLMSTEYLLNINFPNSSTVKDVCLGKLHYRQDEEFFVKENDGFYAYRHMEQNFKDPETDCYQVENDIVSIVPLARSYFDNSLYLKLQNKIK